LFENLHVHTLGPPLTRIARQKIDPWNEESSSPADSFKLNARQTRRTEQARGLFRHRDEGRNRRRWIPEQITRLVDGHVRALCQSLDERHIQSSGGVLRPGRYAPWIFVS